MKLIALISFSFLLILFPSFITIAQSSDSLNFVVAQKGDGIYKILRDNGYVAKDFYHIFVELNKDKIKKDESLILGEKYFLPAKLVDTVVVSEEIVTDTIRPNKDLMYADSVIDDKLKGTIIYLISGHGGPDPGAVAEVNGNVLCEDEYAYDICRRVAIVVEEHGGKAFLIINDPDDGVRDEKFLKPDYDEYCWPDAEIPLNHNARLAQRADAVNNIYYENKSVAYQRVIEIHLDSRAINSTVDVFFYHFPGSKKGKNTAQCIQKVFAEKYAKYQPNRGYSGTVGERNLLVMRKVLPPEVLIELGNIQNEKDRKRFLDADNRQAIAKWITEGVIEDFNSTK